MRLFSSMAFVLMSAAGVRAQPVAVDPRFVIEPLASTLPTPLVAPGTGTAGFSFDLYVTTSLDAEVVRISRDGVVLPFADLSAISGALFWPGFDRVGNFGGLLVAPNDAFDPPDALFAVNAAGGGALLLAGPGPDNDAGAFDPFGDFNGDYFLHDGSLQAVFRLGPDGEFELFASNVPDGAGQIAFAPAGDFGPALYIAGGASRRIYRLDPAHVPGDPAPVWVDFDALGLDHRPVGIAAASSGRFSPAIYINDSRSRSILAIAGSGLVIGPVVRSIGAGAIWLPDSGPFNQTMILSENVLGNLHVLSPACAADLTGDGTLNLFDFLAFQSAFGQGQPMADLAPPYRTLNLFDFLAFQSAFGGGCE